jgi:hypothetical protein
MSRRPVRFAFLAGVAALAIVASSCAGKKSGADRPGATTTTTSDETATSGSNSVTTTAPAGSTTTEPGAEPQNRVIEINIVGGSVEGGVRRETVKQNEQITIRVTSDVADELHVHTYDLKLNLTPGQSADLTFLAKIPGVFEVELEKRAKKVLELEVRP